MKLVLRWALSALLVIGAMLGLAGLTLRFLFPRVALRTEQKIIKTPEKLARGTYLAEHVAVCVDCHSDRDFSSFSGPVIKASLGRGGERFGRDLGIPGELVASNITPVALSDWSDAELVDAITAGVTPDGRALFPMMNWPAFATLCEEDLASVVTYVRSLAPKEHAVAATSLDFPVNLLIRSMPRGPAAQKPCPDPNDSVAQGRYLVGLAGCAECHTPRKGAEPIAELTLSGGVPFPLPTGGVVRSANITPDRKTGIGAWTREAFIARFARYRDPANVPKVSPGGFNTLMPWTLYAGMTDDDLGAIYDYLRTQKAVEVASTQRFAAR